MRAALLIYVLLLFNSLFANKYEFKNFDSSDGLAYRLIYNMIQDEDGFLWIGTANGLSRFDGYSFKNFNQNHSPNKSLKGTEIYNLVDGGNNILWLSTDAGLEYFNKVTEEFSLVETGALKDNVFYQDISIDEQERVWVHSPGNGYMCYDPKRDSIVKHLKGKLKTEGGKEITMYHFRYHKGDLWIAGVEGTAVYDLEDESFKFIDSTRLSSYCHSMRVVRGDYIIMSYLYEGILIINTSDNSTEWVMKADLDKQLGVGTTLFDAVVEKDGTLLISVGPGFVTVKDEKVEYFNNNSRDSFFDGDVISCFYRDRSDNIWIGTFGRGLFSIKKDKSAFSLSSRLYKDDIDKTFMVGSHVFKNGSFLYADKQKVYVCDDYTDLQPNCGKVIKTVYDPTVSGLDNRYCIVSSTDSMFIYDSENQSFRFSHLAKAPACSYRDKKGTIWTGTWTGKIIGYNEETQKKYLINSLLDVYDPMPIFTITEGLNGSLWIGTFGQGLIHIENPYADKPSFIPYNKRQKGDLYINTNSIRALYKDPLDNLWVGTLSAGLIKRDLKTGKHTSYTKANGMKSDVIESIISDNSGNIWCSSNVLTKLDISQNIITHYSEAQGIEGEFISKVCSRSSTGDLIFVSAEGVYVFNPETVSQFRETEKPFLTNFKINGIDITVNDTIDNQQPYVESITYSDELNIPLALNSFAIEFASIEYQNYESVQYQYILEGVDDNWVHSDPSLRLASYTKVPSGEYTFKVRSSFETGKWSKPASIKINVVPPWWQTVQFKIILGILIISLIILIIVFRFRQIKQINKLLERKVLERTENLKHANEIMEEDQLVIEMKNEQLSEAIDAKDKLLSVLAHDFKNPLNGILGMSDLLNRESKKLKLEKVSKYASVIYSSAHSLVNQMITLLDWVQSQESDLIADPVEVNVEILLDDVISLVSGSISQKEIAVSVQNNCKTNVFADPRMASMVFRNILSNAIKYTPRGGKIIIISTEIDNRIDIAFYNTGEGIEQSVLEKLQSESDSIVSAPGTEREKGTGLGLRLCRNFLNKNNGTLTISSEEGKGATFTVSLPKGKKLAVNKMKPVMVESAPEEKLVVDKADKQLILVVEDDAETLKVIKDVLEPDYTVVHAENGVEGVRMANQLLPNVIISDINMKGMTGIEMCSILKNDQKTIHIPLLIISSHSEEDVKNKAFENGANDYTEKPFNPFHLKKKVESLVVLHQKISDKVRKELANEEFPELPDSFNNDLIKKVSDFIDKHIADEKLNANLLASELGVSRSKMWRVFKEETGKTPGDFIKEKRLHKASAMLKTGKYRVSDVAYEIGFSDTRYFTRWFSKEFGMPPSEYAKSMKKK